MYERELRILHLIASNFVGGPEKQILRHALEATAPGAGFWIGSFRDKPSRSEILQEAESLGVSTLELSSGRFLPRTTVELVRWLRQKQISLVCTHGFKANVVGWLAGQRARVPQICFVRGWTAETWRVRQYERLDRLVLSRAPWVVTVSQALAGQLQQKRRCLNPPVVIPNAALFTDQQVSLPVDRRAIRRSLGPFEDAFWVCAVGRLSAEKGHRYLVDALPSMVSRMPNLRCFFLGEGRERQELDAQLTRLGMRDRAIFAGFQKDVRPWVQACDVLVNPSLTEGMPNAVLEAMSLGTPVVATAVGGVPDLITDQESGLLVVPGDPPALAGAVYSLWADSSLALRLAKNAQARVRDYSPEEQSRLLLDLYAKVLGLPQGPSGGTGILVPAGGTAGSQDDAGMVA
jgi:glycosyltransferase involved in cell wall biosynthesis